MNARAMFKSLKAIKDLDLEKAQVSYRKRDDLYAEQDEVSGSTILTEQKKEQKLKAIKLSIEQVEQEIAQQKVAVFIGTVEAYLGEIVGRIGEEAGADDLLPAVIAGLHGANIASKREVTLSLAIMEKVMEALPNTMGSLGYQLTTLFVALNYYGNQFDDEKFQQERQQQQREQQLKTLREARRQQTLEAQKLALRHACEVYRKELETEIRKELLEVNVVKKYDAISVADVVSSKQPEIIALKSKNKQFALYCDKYQANEAMAEKLTTTKKPVAEQIADFYRERDQRKKTIQKGHDKSSNWFLKITASVLLVFTVVGIPAVVGLWCTKWKLEDKKGHQMLAKTKKPEPRV